LDNFALKIARSNSPQKQKSLGSLQEHYQSFSLKYSNSIYPENFKEARVFCGLPPKFFRRLSMKRFRKLLINCVIGGLVLISAYLLLLYQVPPANASFDEITFEPFCVTVNLSTNEPLSISVIPNWSHPNVGNQVDYRLYLGQIGTGCIIFTATIYEPNSLSTNLSASLTPTGEYTHLGEYAPFLGRSGPFWVDRGSQF
jgi:hypothetical protein